MRTIFIAMEAPKNSFTLPKKLYIKLLVASSCQENNKGQGQNRGWHRLVSLVLV